MHKACGWMLRELGKRNEVQLKIFLNDWGTQLPRTVIRYAIERFEAQERELYLKITKSK
jgi:3-methyladenine DNA glycosylase AlkD